MYATCTVHPSENGQLIDGLLALRPELRRLEQWQLWPGEQQGAGDGFFAALLQTDQGLGGGGASTGGGSGGGDAGASGVVVDGVDGDGAAGSPGAGVPSGTTD